MTKLRIYELAYFELLRKLDFEEKRLASNPNNRIFKHWIEQFQNEINELHEMILIEEKTI